MPFTVSHAVLTIPLRRTALPASAVAVGAMTPDLRLYLPVGPLYGATHSLAWLPVTTAVAGALWLSWLLLVAPAASDLSPAALAARYPGPRGTRSPAPAGATSSPLSRALLTTAALALGVLTHLVWDAFTHHGRWSVEALPVLEARVGGTPLYSWFQDLSGALGLVVIAVWAARLPRHALDPASRGRHHRLRLLTTVGVTAALVAGLAVGLDRGGPAWRIAYGFTTTALAAAAIVVVAGSITWHVQRRRDNRTNLTDPTAHDPCTAPPVTPRNSPSPP